MTDQEYSKVLGELSLERERLRPKFHAAERLVRDHADKLAKLGLRLNSTPHVFTPEDETLLEKAPELIALIRDYLAMRARLQELNQTLGG